MGLIPDSCPVPKTQMDLSDWDIVRWLIQVWEGAKQQTRRDAQLICFWGIAERSETVAQSEKWQSRSVWAPVGDVLWHSPGFNVMSFLPVMNQLMRLLSLPVHEEEDRCCLNPPPPTFSWLSNPSLVCPCALFSSRLFRSCFKTVGSLTQIMEPGVKIKKNEPFHLPGRLYTCFPCVCLQLNAHKHRSVKILPWSWVPCFQRSDLITV